MVDDRTRLLGLFDESGGFYAALLAEASPFDESVVVEPVICPFPFI